MDVMIRNLPEAILPSQNPNKCRLFVTSTCLDRPTPMFVWTLGFLEINDGKKKEQFGEWGDVAGSQLSVVLLMCFSAIFPRFRCAFCSWGVEIAGASADRASLRKKTHGAFNGLSLSTKMDNWHQLATLRIPPVIKQHRNGRIINKWQNPLPCIAMTDYQREGCLIPSNVVIIAHLHYANKTCAGGHQILPWRTYLILVCEDSCSITNYLVRTSSLYKPNEHEYNLCLWHLVLSDYLQWDINFSINCWSTTWHIINKNTDDWPSPCFALLEHNFHWLSLDITRRSLNR